MVKVVIDRDGCVSCASCWTTCPDFFEHNPDDNLSQICKRRRIKNRQNEGDAPPEEETCVRDAAELCPVQVISIIEDEDGSQ